MGSQETTHIETNINGIKISVPEAQMILALSERAKKLGGVILPEEKDMKLMIIAFAEELLANFAGYEAETFLEKLLARGDITRYSEADDLLSDELRQGEYSFGSLPINKKNRLIREDRLYKGLIDGHAFGKDIDGKDKRLQRDFRERVEEESLEPASVVAYQVLKDSYPVEILKALNVDYAEVSQFAFSIVQMEKLIREKRIHKIAPAPSSTANAFFVKRIDNTIRLISMYYGDHTRRRNYAIRTIPYNDFEGTLRAVVEKSKLFLNIPKDDTSIPQMPIK